MVSHSFYMKSSRKAYQLHPWAAVKRYVAGVLTDHLLPASNEIAATGPDRLLDRTHDKEDPTGGCSPLSEEGPYNPKEWLPSEWDFEL